MGTSQIDGIYGLAGNDRLQGLGGNDTLDGGLGFDRAIYTDATGGIGVNLAAGAVSGPAVGSDTLNGVEGIVGSSFADTYNATGFNGDSGVPGTPVGFNEFEGGGGDDTIISAVNSLGAALTRVSYLNATAGVTVDIAAGTADGDASVGHDTFVGSGIIGASGSAHDDTLSGSNNGFGTVELFEGRAGNDTINGRGGFDRADYNNDPTTTSGITVNMAAGTVTGDATVGTDTLISVEAVRGTHFADTYDATGYSNGSFGTFNEFTGNGGNDTIIGNGNTRLGFNNATAGITIDLAAGIASGDASVGTDTFSGVNAVHGSMFADTIYGAATNDTFAGIGGDDFIDGRDGFDTVSFSNIYLSVASVSVNMASGTAVGSDSTIGTDTFRNIESIQGTMLADSYTAVGYGLAGAANVSTSNGNFNQFEGLGGDDSITGNGATRVNYVNAADGVTITIGAGGSGSSHGTAAGDVATVGTDTFVSGVNSANGSNFADIYNASAFNNGFNSFQGNGGNDQVTGNGSTQVIYSNATSGVNITIGAGGAGTASGDGSIGTDTFVSGVNSAVGSNQADTYNASAFGSGLFNSFQGNGGNDTITGNGSTQVQYNNATGGVNINLSTGIATGDASIGADTITGGVNSVQGSNFADTITGSSGNDFLFGNNGNDIITGGGGNDSLTGGAGNDNFAFVASSTNGATITDFTGNAASVGDTLEFHGFGTAAEGATLTFVSGNQWQVHSGLDGHNEIIAINGSVHASDYQFLA